MARLIFLFAFLSLSISSAFAQISNIVFIGTLTLTGGQAYSYKIQVSDSNGIVSGYSITDLMGPNETKTLLKGTINTDQQLLKFNETRVVYTKSKAGEDLCFVNATLKATSKKGTTVLKGSFKGYQSDGKTICASGTLLLVSAKDVMDKLMKTDMKKDTAIISKLLAGEPAEQKKITTVYEKEEVIPDSKITKVTPGMVKEISCSGASAKLQVWDARNIDGDIITVTQNGKVILDNYKISGTYKDINLSLRANMSDTLKVIAISEGSEPLNTARVKITTPTDTHYIDASTTLDKPIWIVLKK